MWHATRCATPSCGVSLIYGKPSRPASACVEFEQSPRIVMRLNGRLRLQMALTARSRTVHLSREGQFGEALHPARR